MHLFACLKMGLKKTNTQEMSGAEAGMSVLAQAAGLLDIEDAVEEDGTLSGSYSDNSSSGALYLSLIHISEPTRLGMISYAVFCLKKKK